LQFNVFADEESENSVASTSTTGECSSTETTSSSFVQFPTSTEDSTAASETFSVSVQYPTSTEESYPTSETISVTSLGTTITPTPVYYGSVNSGAIETATPLEAQETDTGSPLSAEESNEKKNLKGGLSVGILGVALLLLVSFYCILVRRRKLMDEQREKLLGTQAWMTGSVVDIREAS
jgi:Mn2+/Fe2+ NRAMP family transporter